MYILEYELKVMTNSVPSSVIIQILCKTKQRAEQLLSQKSLGYADKLTYTIKPLKKKE